MNITMATTLYANSANSFESKQLLGCLWCPWTYVITFIPLALIFKRFQMKYIYHNREQWLYKFTHAVGNAKWVKDWCCFTCKMFGQSCHFIANCVLSARCYSYFLILFRSTEYRILGKKGEGTFSEVLKVQDIRDGTYYACKKMKKRYER